MEQGYSHTPVAVTQAPAKPCRGERKSEEHKQKARRQAEPECTAAFSGPNPRLSQPGAHLPNNISASRICACAAGELPQFPAGGPDRSWPLSSNNRNKPLTYGDFYLGSSSIFTCTVPQVLAALMRDGQEDKDCPPISQKPKLKFKKVALLTLHHRLRKQDNWTPN